MIEFSIFCSLKLARKTQLCHVDGYQSTHHGVQAESQKDWGMKTEKHSGMGRHWRWPQDETSPLSGWWKITRNTRTRPVMEDLGLWHFQWVLAEPSVIVLLPDCNAYAYRVLLASREAHVLFYYSSPMSPNCRPWLGQLSFLCYLNPKEDKYWSLPVKILPLSHLFQKTPVYIMRLISVAYLVSWTGVSLLPVTFPPLRFRSWSTKIKATIPYSGKEKDVKTGVFSQGWGILVPYQDYFQVFKHSFPVLGVVENTSDSNSGNRDRRIGNSRLALATYQIPRQS